MMPPGALERAGGQFLLTGVDLADDAVIRFAVGRGMGRPRLLVAGGAFVGAVMVLSAE
jgi:hypothetical protein